MSRGKLVFVAITPGQYLGLTFTESCVPCDPKNHLRHVALCCYEWPRQTGKAWHRI